MRNQDPVVAAREIEPLGRRLVLLDPCLERLGRAILDQIGQVLDELLGALASEIVALRKGEDFLELVEDQQRNERPAGRVVQDVVAMMQELPQRFAGHRDARLRPLAGFLRRTEDRGLDLFGGRGRFPRIVDAHVHRAVVHRPKPRHDAGAQHRGLAEARLPEQQREGLALHAPDELRYLILATVEIRARFLGEGREPEPRMLRVDRRLGCRAVRSGRRVTRRWPLPGRLRFGQRVRRSGAYGAFTHDEA